MNECVHPTKKSYLETRRGDLLKERKRVQLNVFCCDVAFTHRLTLSAEAFSSKHIEQSIRVKISTSCPLRFVNDHRKLKHRFNYVCNHVKFLDKTSNNWNLTHMTPVEIGTIVLTLIF